MQILVVKGTLKIVGIENFVVIYPINLDINTVSQVNVNFPDS